MSRQLTLGILREVKSTWERRTPLIPQHVKQLIKQHNIRVVVQPSTNRIYTDNEYTAAGAIIDSDLSRVNCIVGVKEQPTKSLLSNKSYMMFNHVIKAQPYNMNILDHCLHNNIRLYDYEAIRSNNDQNQRSVAFGKFAGYAGMIDTLRGVGERYLALGYSTPFLSIGSSYMYPTLQHAMNAVKAVGEQIIQYGLPKDLCPMTFVFTGSGNVSQGARAMFDLLPHQYVEPSQLSKLTDRNPHMLYGSVITAQHMVSRIDKHTDKFDTKHYYANPSLYRPIAHETIIPYTSVLMNGMYWSPVYPRLLTIEQLKQLHQQGNYKLQVIGDVSCDINGSIEFLSKATTIDKPFYLYDSINNTTCDTIDNRAGVLMMGVDCLPTEFAEDASEFFSTALLPFMPSFTHSDTTKSFIDTAHTYLQPELYNACIVADNKLTPGFQYIQRLRDTNAKVAQSMNNNSTTSDHLLHRNISINAHMFDTGYINAALDIMEQIATNFKVISWSISPNRTQRDINTSQAIIMVSCIDQTQLDLLLTKLHELAARMPSSKAVIELLPIDRTITSNVGLPASYSDSIKSQQTDSVNDTSKTVHTAAPNRVLVLGSGFVAAPTVEYLSRTQHNNVVTIASNIISDAQSIASTYNNVHAVELDIQHTQRLTQLIQQHDIVISLLPATMHINVARLCIEHKRHLVTASYMSAEMQALDVAAKSAGISMINEIGLDPGLDHMSAMSIIDSVHTSGGKVLSFKSLCGGLPAPECIDNPFNYKFSWSPLGVLNATQHAATYLQDGTIKQIPRNTVLSTAQFTNIFPTLQLEYYANRDSLSYMPIYNINDVHTMYRGTLRYNGYSQLMHNLVSLGLMSNDVQQCNSSTVWSDVMSQLLHCKPNNILNAIADRLIASHTESNATNDVIHAVQWLGLDSDTQRIGTHNTTLNAFCGLLQQKLSYTNGQRDMVAMHHTFNIRTKSGFTETLTSSLLSYGGDGKQRKNNIYMPGGGLNGYSAMSRTVGLPVAITAQLLLQKQITQTGCYIPIYKNVYVPVLEMLSKEGIQCVERVVATDKNVTNNNTVIQHKLAHR